MEPFNNVNPHRGMPVYGHNPQPAYNHPCRRVNINSRNVRGNTISESFGMISGFVPRPAHQQRSGSEGTPAFHPLDLLALAGGRRDAINNGYGAEYNENSHNFEGNVFENVGNMEMLCYGQPSPNGRRLGGEKIEAVGEGPRASKGKRESYKLAQGRARPEDEHHQLRKGPAPQHASSPMATPDTPRFNDRGYLDHPPGQCDNVTGQTDPTSHEDENMTSVHLESAIPLDGESEHERPASPMDIDDEGYQQGFAHPSPSLLNPAYPHHQMQRSQTTPSGPWPGATPHYYHGYPGPDYSSNPYNNNGLGFIPMGPADSVAVGSFNCQNNRIVGSYKSSTTRSGRGKKTI